jgi:hypothetical protein
MYVVMPTLLQVSKPVEVVEAEKGTCTDDDIKILIQEYQVCNCLSLTVMLTELSIVLHDIH